MLILQSGGENTIVTGGEKKNSNFATKGYWKFCDTFAEDDLKFCVLRELHCLELQNHFEIVSIFARFDVSFNYQRLLLL